MTDSDRTLRSAVVIDPAFLGDVVFDAPLVRAIRLRNPGCRVGMLVRPPADVIARRIVGADEVHVFDKYGLDRGWPGLARIARGIASAGYEAAFVPHPSVRSALLARLARIPTRVGYSGGLAGLFHTRRIRACATDTFVDARLRLVGGGTPSLSEASVAPPKHVGRILRVGLVLGSAWQTKRWDVEQATDFARSLDQERFQLVLLGSPSEHSLFEPLLPHLHHAQDAVGATLDEMLDVLASCDVVVAGDTSPLHMARALGLPVVALFGPTSERMHCFSACDRVLSVELECRPCSPHGHRVCPLGHHRCMRELPASRVLEAVEELLAR